MGGITKYWKDDVYITVFVNNCGNKTRTFYVGCNIISPSGYITPSSEFYYPGQKYLPVSVPAGETKSVTFKENLGHGLTSESQIIGRHNITTCVYSDSGLSKDQKCREGQDYIQIVAKDIGYYAFYSKPVKAVIYWMGEKVGVTNDDIFYKFTPGTYTIEFRATGYNTRRIDINVEKGKYKTYEVTLTPTTVVTCLYKLRAGYPQQRGLEWFWSFVNVNTGAITGIYTTSSSKSSLPLQYQCGV